MAGGIQPGIVRDPAAFGFAAPPAAVVQSGRASECWTVTADDVDAWLRIAQPGQTFIYCHGPQLVQGGAAARVRDLTAEKSVTPHHKRTADGGFDFFIRRNRPPPVHRAPVCDPVMIALLVELQDAAQGGRRCPTDAALGHAVGLTAPQVKWWLRKLEDSKFIRRRTVKTAADPRFRIVTIVATGQSTAEPKP